MPPETFVRLASAGLLGIAAMASGGCTKDLLPSYDVEVSVLGNPSPVTVTLEWAGGSEQLTLGPDATDSFASQMAVGTSIVLRGPTDCRFRNGDISLAVTSTNQPTQIRLACPDTLEISNLGLSAPMAVLHDALSYQLTLPALAADPNPIVTVAPTLRYPGVTVEVNSAGSGDGDLTTDRLKLGTNHIDVVFDEFLLRRRYTVTLQRAAAARELGRLPGATTSAALGKAVAAQGNLMVIGEPGAAFGRAYVYKAQATPTGPTWMLEATLAAEASAGTNSGFGEAVAISGDRIAIGAPRDGAADVGAVYVYGKQGTTWTLLIRHSFAVPGSRFGEAVALSPTGLLVVGAPGEAAGGSSNAGSIYVYASAGTTGAVNRVPPNRTQDDEFGKAVAILGTTILVGAPGDDDGSMSAAAPPAGDPNNLTDAGAVYAYSATGTLTRYLKQATPTTLARFGERLAARGDLAVAISRAAPSGSVDCYGATLQPRGSVILGFPVAALALDSDRLAVAHPAAGTGSDLRVSAYRLKPDGSNPDTIAPAFLGSSAIGADEFGRALAFGGDQLYVTAPLQGASDAGAFYVFE